MGKMLPLKKYQLKTNLVLLVDPETGEYSPNGVFKLLPGSVEAQVLNALRQKYDCVCVMPFDSNGERFRARIIALNPKLVFNLTEWIDGDRSKDYLITQCLDRLGIPFTGSAMAGLRLARTKKQAKAVVAAMGIATPTDYSLRHSANITYPAFVKPAQGDGSDAISRKSLVRNQRQLLAQVKSLAQRRLGPTLCEEFIEGHDLFVALLGNEPQVLAPLQLVVSRQSRGAPCFATSQLKHDEHYKRHWGVRYVKAQLSEALMSEIEQSSRLIFHALHLRDYARIDYRLTEEGRLVFIEVNPNPDLGRHTFGRNLCFADVQYTDLIQSIVDAAVKREGIENFT